MTGGAVARFTAAAERDVEAILRGTLRRFGPAQLRGYAAHLERAAALVAADPRRPGTRARPELGEAVRSFHAERAAGRRGAAAHVLFFVALPEAGAVLVLRVLHEAMDPTRHLEPDGS